MAEKEEKGLVAFDEKVDLALFEEDKVEVLLERIDEKMESEIALVDPEAKDYFKTIRTVVNKGVLSRGVVVKAVNARTKEWRDKTKTVNAARDKFIETSLENEAKHRKPLTDFENAEKARIAAHESNLEILRNLTEDIEPYDAVTIKARLDEAIDSPTNELWEEFLDQATELKATIVSSLQMSYDARKKYEDEQAELEQLRQDKIARDKKDEEERLRKEGEEKAKVEAEAKAKEEAERVKNEAAAAAEREAKAVQDKKDAEAREEQAKKDAKIAAEKAEADRIQAEKDAEARERKAADEAAEKAMREQAAEKLREKREAEAREADKAHHAEINNAAVDCFVAGLKIDVDLAKCIVKLIALKKVSNVTISY